MRQWILFVHLVCGLFYATFANAQLFINEICPTNSNLIANYNGDYDDWFEIYNAGAAVNMGGYGVSDDSTKPYRFVFPPSYTLDAGRSVLIFASSQTNGYVADHWEMPVNAGTTWSYKPGEATLDTNWRNVSYDATSWSTGYGGIGFGDGDDNTIIPVGVSLMMRRAFSIPDTSQIVKAVLKMDYDDGFVAYLNGVEIARANLGTEGVRPEWNELAAYSHEAKTYRGGSLDSFYIDKQALLLALRPGTNVLAIEVHNSQENSDDMSAIPYLFFGMRSPGLTYIPKPGWFNVPDKDYFNANFKLSRDGETIYLYNNTGGIVNQFTYPVIDINHSYCRIPDGSPAWCFSKTPSPGTSNNSSQCFSGYALAPLFSIDGGYYATSRSVSLLTQTPGGIIRYTTNGNTPGDSDLIYSSPINVSSTQTIRARVFVNGLLPGPVVTNTYIINGKSHLSTFSITTDSLNLWDFNTGIYAMGPNADSTTPYKGANFWQDWTKPVTVEYYDKNKNKVIRFDADIEIYGNYSRAKPQKSFEIKMRDSYGTGSFDYSMYSDKPFVDKVDDIILRNSGTDWNKVHFRDGMMERIMKPTFINYLAAEPTIAYLNGAYWGVYHINENHDHHWMKSNYGLDRKELDYLKEAGTSITIQEGTDESFWQLYNYATTVSPTTTQYYTDVDKMLDLKVYTDYFVAETFYNNGDWIGDWTNNIMMWRKAKDGEKWKYMLYDLDYGLGLKGDVHDNRLSMARNPVAFSYSSEMFDAILKNPTYKRYFINRYADLMNTAFLPANITATMHSFKDTMAYDMTDHFAKWGSNATTWDGYIKDMMDFASARPDIMRNYIKTEFGLNGVVTLSFAVSPLGSGRIEISTVIPKTYPWTGDYFNGNPVTITAIPNPGYTFDHWRSSKIINTNNYNKSVTYNFNKPDAIKAFFTGSAVTPKISVSEINYNCISTFNSGDWLEIHNYGTTTLDITGWKICDGMDNHKFVFPTGTTIAANGYLVIVEDSVKFRKQYPNITNWIGELGFNLSNAGDQIRLFNYNDVLYLSFFYQQITPWPMLADGQGYTCEHIADNADHNDGSKWYAGCFGGSPGRANNNTLAFPIAVTGSTTFCTGSSTQLAGTTFTTSVTNYQWKRNGTNISGATDSVYSAGVNGLYSVNITNNGCSAVTPGVSITSVSQQPQPTTTSSSRCGTGNLTLMATGTDSIFWYDASVAGNLIGTGNTLNVTHVTQTTSYYAVNGRNCPSNPVAAVAEIIPLASSPAITDTFRCGPGALTLMASDTAEIRWYNVPSGGGLLATGTTFTTGSLDNDTIFYLEAGSVCPSSRVEVNVSIQSTTAPVATDAGRCGDGTVTLNAVSNLPLFWYDQQAGGNLLGTGTSFTTPMLNATDTFYVEANTGCPSPRIMSLAIINAIPPDPIVRDTLNCTPTSFELTADATEQLNWYDAPVGGNLLYTGMIFQTPFVSSTTTFYTANGYTCLSNRVPLHVMVPVTPAVPVAADQSRCNSGTITLTASATQQIYWYDAPVGGNLLGTGSTFTTPYITSNATYYVESGDTCMSQRTAVNAIISATQLTTAFDAFSCGAGSVVLTANSNVPADSIYWYDAPGGNIIGTGISYTTPFLNNTMTYYVQAHSTCTGAPVEANAFIYTPPSLQLNADTMFIESGQSAILDAGMGYNYYSWSTGETSQQIMVSSQGIYSVVITDQNGCNASDQVVVILTTSSGKNYSSMNLGFYPNPAKDHLTVSVAGAPSRIALSLISVDGKIIFKEELKTMHGQINKTVSLSGVSSGIYFVQVEGEGFSRKEKVLVDRE